MSALPGQESSRCESPIAQRALQDPPPSSLDLPMSLLGKGAGGGELDLAGLQLVES